MLGEALIEHVNAAAWCTFIRLAHPFEGRWTRRDSGSAFRSVCRQSPAGSGLRHRAMVQVVVLGCPRPLREEVQPRLVGEQPDLRRASSKDLFWFLVKDILTVYV